MLIDVFRSRLQNFCPLDWFFFSTRLVTAAHFSPSFQRQIYFIFFYAGFFCGFFQPFCPTSLFLHFPSICLFIFELFQTPRCCPSAPTTVQRLPDPACIPNCSYLANSLKPIPFPVPMPGGQMANFWCSDGDQATWLACLTDHQLWVFRKCTVTSAEWRGWVR